MSMGVVRRLSLIALLLALTLLGAACQNARNPVAPAAAPSVPSALAAVPSGGNAHPLVETAASVPRGAEGMVNSVPTAAPQLNTIEVTINVHGAPPNTDLFVQIAHDAYLGPVPGRADGTCDRAMQFGFPSPPTHTGGDAGVLHTSEGGSASTHIRFELPHGLQAGAYEPGGMLDQMIRVVDATQTFELRTGCMTMTWR
jgi:hypothetical protein